MPWAFLVSIPLSIPHANFGMLLLVRDSTCSDQRGPGRVIITVRGTFRDGDTLKVVVQDPRIAEEVCPALSLKSPPLPSFQLSVSWSWVLSCRS